jgi:hypothetical protein
MSVFILTTENGRDRMASAWGFACQFLELGRKVKVVVTEAKPTRTTEQNSRLWALLTDVSRQVQWKDIFTAAHTKGQRVAQGIDGGFVMLGSHTSRMSVGDMIDLQTLIEAFGVEHDVRFNGPVA